MPKANGVQKNGRMAHERLKELQSFWARGAADVVAKELESQCWDFAVQLKDEIESERFDLAPLSEQWTRYKAKHGLDPRILIATGEFINAFTVDPLVDGRTGYVAHVADVMHEGGVPMRLLDRWLEYGTEHMPARAHWRPLSLQWKLTKKRKIAASVRERLTEEMKTILRK